MNDGESVDINQITAVIHLFTVIVYIYTLMADSDLMLISIFFFYFCFFLKWPILSPGETLYKADGLGYRPGKNQSEKVEKGRKTGATFKEHGQVKQTQVNWKI